MWWVEHRMTVKRNGPVRLVPLDQIHKYTGFRSAFAFDDETAEQIRRQGGTHDLQGVAVFADTLFVDFDASDGSDLQTWLIDHGIEFSRWDSGGRSVHFHIPLEPVAAAWVPAACKQFLKSVAPLADTSFLHQSGMYRLPFSYHWKTGRQKVLTERHDGRRLQLQEPPAESFDTEERGNIERFFTMLTATKTEGQRSPFIWQLATVAAEVGLTYDEALEHLRWWNYRFCNPPRDDRTLQTQCASAYRRLTKRKLS